MKQGERTIQCQHIVGRRIRSPRIFIPEQVEIWANTETGFAQRVRMVWIATSIKQPDPCRVDMSNFVGCCGRNADIRLGWGGACCRQRRYLSGRTKRYQIAADAKTILSRCACRAKLEVGT